MMQALRQRVSLLRLVSLLLILCVAGCSTPTTTRQKVTRAAIISGGAAAALTLALGGDAGQAIAIGAGTAALVGGLVYVRNEMSIGRANVARAEAELARLRAENSDLSRKITAAQGSRLAAFQLGTSKNIVVVDLDSGKALQRDAVTTSGAKTQVGVGFELSNLPAEPGEGTNVAYRTEAGESERSFGVIYLGKI